MGTKAGTLGKKILKATGTGLKTGGKKAFLASKIPAKVVAKTGKVAGKGFKIGGKKVGLASKTIGKTAVKVGKPPGTFFKGAGKFFKKLVPGSFIPL